MAEITPQKLQSELPLFDTRLYRTLQIYEKGKDPFVSTFYPHFNYDSYAEEFHPTVTAIQNQIESAGNQEQKEQLEKYKKEISKFVTDGKTQYTAPRSFIHPYALVKLAGAYGEDSVTSRGLGYDKYNNRKFYEIDGESGFSGNYSKTPTTTTLVRWGNESSRGSTPYSFQDFAFCKWWNKIENNRLITLRRYAMPVTDNIEFADYDVDEYTASDKSTYKSAKGETYSGTNARSAFVPLATAVTYFGEDTGNKLSEILKFSAGYKWAKLNSGDKNPHLISVNQVGAEDDIINGNGGGIFGGVSSVLSGIGYAMGFLGDVSNGKTINIEGAISSTPPDPYYNGPYENRILGPINVITETYRRDRGLEFKSDGLSITFEYVSRPIAGINNKAVLLDLLANMLVLTYSSGTWYGGMWRFRSSKPSVYPFKYGDTMNKIYRGELFGKNGAIESLTKNVFADAGNSLSTFLPDAISAISNMFSGVVNRIKQMFTHGSEGKSEEEMKKESEEKFQKAFDTRTMKSIQKVIAAKALRGATIPFIQNQRALLTGEPVGDWHLTIGNPLNPIAMIGNLIVDNVTITFSDELGPDDFPIGFKAVVSLKHGLGRDRDAIESMFNRGYGRIYSLSDTFRSSADGETRVDENTGGANTKEGRTSAPETRNTYWGGGSFFISKIQQSELKNKGAIYSGFTQSLESLKPTSEVKIKQSISTYFVNPWQMGYTM